MPEYNPKQNYNNAYRITARFLVWAEKAYDKKLVRKLYAALRDKTYTNNTWKELTGKTVEKLWDEYSRNPVVELTYR